MIQTFQPDSPWLILAPHIKYPLRNGGDILLEKIAHYISYHVPHVILMGMDTIRRYERGTVVEDIEFPNKHRDKRLASVQTLLFQGHYLERKFNTKLYTQRALYYLQKPDYKTVLYSYISTTFLQKYSSLRTDQFSIICTQNDEFKWFEDLQSPNLSVFTRLVAWQSYRWLKAWFADWQDNFLFLHVSSSDAKGFDRYFPQHSRLLMSVGADEEDIDCELTITNSSEQITLLFVGSLSTQMNYDALTCFAQKFYPVLHNRLGEALSIQIVGSSPSSLVQQLCSSMNWNLHANVSDTELRSLLQTASFSILPFNYATGAKLKLLKSLSNGLPYLATPYVVDPSDIVPAPCYVSNDPKGWVDHLMGVQTQGGVSPEERLALRSFASQFTWRNVISQLFTRLQQYAPSANLD